MKVWLITGVSSGLGRAIADAARAAGDRVVGILRDEEQRKAFESSSGSVGVILDVTDTANIQPAVDRIERDVGLIEVLVNNAGYGHEGTFEESTLEDLRRQFEVNVFGAVGSKCEWT
jgi:NAD(P)-dependent dehydrogenase (short-subunit alcohol dehydrogenase family)